MPHFSEPNEMLTPSKRKIRRRHLIIFWLIFLTSVFIISATVYFVFFSQIIKVQKFSIDGNRVVGRSELEELITKKLNSRGWFVRKISEKNILYWFGVKEIRDSGIAAADEVLVHTNLTDRTVAVEIKERVFAGIWCGDSCFGFDSNGVAYFLAPDTEGSLILKIKDENNVGLTLGQPVIADEKVLSNIFKTIAIIKENNILIDGVTIKDATLREWELKSTKGTQFKFSLDFVPDKLKSVIDNLKGRTKLEALNYIDFRVQNRVYFK